MKLGYCCDLDRLDSLERAGIGYVELMVAQVLAWTQEQRATYIDRLRTSPVRFESVNCLIGGFSLYDDCQNDFAQTKAHFGRVFPLLASVGVKILVFGSGGYRRVPDGMDREEAVAQLKAFLRVLSEACTPYGFTVALEPLPVRSCNILNTVPESATLVREVNLPNIRLLIDFNHFIYDGELLDVVPGVGDILVHTHIARPGRSLLPEPGDGHDYAAIYRALRAANYRGFVVGEAFIPGLPTDGSGCAGIFERGLRRFRFAMEQAEKGALR